MPINVFLTLPSKNLHQIIVKIIGYNTSKRKPNIIPAVLIDISLGGLSPIFVNKNNIDYLINK